VLRSLVLTLALSATGAAAQEPPSWLDSGTALVPAGCVAGDAYRTDAETMTGYLAVCPVGSDDAKDAGQRIRAAAGACRPPDPGRGTIAADLQPRGDVPRGIATPTTVDNDGKDQDYARLDRELLDGAATPPPGTEPCQLGA
jgi:hypothetical protein